MKSNEVDLHIHSCYSDGTLTPQEILQEAVKKRLKMISVADHNVLDGSRKLINLAKEVNDIEVIPGVEIDTLDDGINYHVLAYGFNLNDEVFSKFVQDTYNILESINVKLIKVLEKEFSQISLEDYFNYTYDRTNGYWKALHYFKDKGLTNNVQEGKRLYAKYGPFYTTTPFPSIQETCKRIKAAGGISILAHPGRVLKDYNLEEFEKEVQRVIEQGIDGIECYYPLHSKEIIELCRNLCEEHSLQITAGADCHGKTGNTIIGENNNLEVGEIRISMKKENKGFSYTEIIGKISDIMSMSKIRQKVALSGGIIPWIMLGEDSKRKHSDIDFFVNSDNMPYIRKFLKKNGIYDSNMDTLQEDGVDFGVDAVFKDISVSFFPYEVIQQNRGIKQKSFYIEPESKEKKTREMFFDGISEDEYISETRLPNGKKINVISLEVLKALKEKSKREKDYSDLDAIDRIGVRKTVFQKIKRGLNVKDRNSLISSIKVQLPSEVKMDVIKNNEGTPENNLSKGEKE